MPLTQGVNCTFSDDNEVSGISNADLLRNVDFREGAKMTCFKGPRYLINLMELMELDKNTTPIVIYESNAPFEAQLR